MIRGISTRIHMRNILEHYRNGKRCTVLEVGCNRGYLLSELQKYADYVYGVDIDEGAIASAMQKGHKVFVCSASNLSLPSKTFDAVVSVHTIEHVPDLLGAVREFCRVLKPGGTLIIIYPYEPITGITCLPFWSLSKRGNIHLRSIKPKYLLQIIQEGKLGLGHVHSRMYYGLNPTYLSVFRKSD
ncbi:MAG: class I SAM-dependent methyltransferase [candidate division WOR-3 bacterium]|nr:MAG: class I SAM-dependent methyltransferase [candidate division WOR-3 bacterium]